MKGQKQQREPRLGPDSMVYPADSITVHEKSPKGRLYNADGKRIVLRRVIGFQLPRRAARG